MPGIFGFAGDLSPEVSDQLLVRMGAALDTRPAGVTLHTHGEPGLRLGCSQLKIADPGEPVWNQERTACVVMDGEIYNAKALRQELAAQGYPFHSKSDAELLLRLYEKSGSSFVSMLNGAFVAAIWDRSQSRLLLFNDRLGLHPLYYAILDGVLLFATGVRALLEYPALSRRVDEIAIAQFLTFDHVLDDRTFLEKVKLFPQGSVLTERRGEVQITPYYSFQYPEQYALRKEAEYIEELMPLLRQAVSSQAEKDDLPVGLLLSGGLDSRVILPLLLAARQGQPLHAFTWGIPGSSDVSYARELCRLTGAQHHFFELKPDWLLHKAQEAVRLTDGMGNLVNLHALATLEQETSYTPAIFKGFLGDAMLGFGLRHQFWASYDEADLIAAHLSVHLDQGVITFGSAQQKLLFTDRFQSAVGTAVWDGYLAGMKAAGVSHMAGQRLFFDYTQRVPRMTIKGVEVVRSQAVPRLPFADNALVEFSMRVPPGLLYERRLIKNAFIQAYPRLAQVPVTESGLPMMHCARDIRLRAENFARWHLRSLGLKGVAATSQHPTKRYDLWFRTLLKDWVEATLLNKRALERGYFNPQFLTQLVSEHMAGANHTVRIGALLSIELWHQLFLDPV